MEPAFGEVGGHDLGIIHWGNIRFILGLYRDDGKQNRDYHNGVIQGLGFRV